MATKSVQEQIVQEQAVDTQVAAKSSVRRYVLIAVSVLLIGCLTGWGIYTVHPGDPYVQSVLQLTGDAARGREIFQLNCAVCHGLEAAGEVGPDLRTISEHKSKTALIEQVISGQTPPMPQFQPSETDMADLLSFLETL
ncbi:MAG: cytochrome c [Phormidesmis sp.]